MKVTRRTFEALKFPKASSERAKLNEDWLTSEYMPSHGYGVRNDDGSHLPFTYRSKAEAERKVQADDAKRSERLTREYQKTYGRNLTPY